MDLCPNENWIAFRETISYWHEFDCTCPEIELHKTKLIDRKRDQKFAGRIWMRFDIIHTWKYALNWYVTCQEEYINRNNIEDGIP